MNAVTSTDRVKEQLRQEYALRFSHQREYRDAVWRVLTAEFFQRYVPRDGTVVDVGCGWGEFINNIIAAKKFAIDLNPDAAQRVNADVQLLEQDCSQHWPLDDGSIDCVFTSNFFEHLSSKDALADTLHEARRCLRPGGRLICMGPNIRYLHGAYWDFWDHCLPLSDTSLREVLQLSGFEIEQCWPRFLPYQMSRRRPPPLLFLRVYLWVPIVWPVFGKQFLIFANKPAG